MLDVYHNRIKWKRGRKTEREGKKTCNKKITTLLSRNYFICLFLLHCPIDNLVTSEKWANSFGCPDPRDPRSIIHTCKVYYSSACSFSGPWSADGLVRITVERIILFSWIMPVLWVLCCSVLGLLWERGEHISSLSQILWCTCNLLMFNPGLHWSVAVITGRPGGHRLSCSS